MKTQFEVRTIDFLGAALTLAVVALIIKAVALDGAYQLADYNLTLAVGWGVAVVVGMMWALLNYAGTVSSVPMLITVNSDGFTVLNLRTNWQRKIHFKQIVSYRFIEGGFKVELRIVLEGRADHIFFLSSYSYYRDAKEFRSMVQAFEEAISRYNQHNDELHVIRRDAPFSL
ncbi:hypothetical protein Q5H92_08005 [Hymenobacter sp. M29]|uniref:PH domain-containing protein n=1 Tax=Hymenobacter mellowenesis TaxID=3063995 RepID=A0ABT9A8X6_9BACT|nr:hypothetical protein [Hymenobacter sp. M29]MDO7846294.1 hypothetical protein [Hymenobacter sp. M29]